MFLANSSHFVCAPFRDVLADADGLDAPLRFGDLVLGAVPVLLEQFLREMYFLWTRSARALAVVDELAFAGGVACAVVDELRVVLQDSGPMARRCAVVRRRVEQEVLGRGVDEGAASCALAGRFVHEVGVLVAAAGVARGSVAVAPSKYEFRERDRGERAVGVADNSGAGVLVDRADHSDGSPWRFGALRGSHEVRGRGVHFDGRQQILGLFSLDMALENVVLLEGPFEGGVALLQERSQRLVAAGHVRRGADNHGAEVVRVGGSFAGARSAIVAASPSAHGMPERVVASKFHVRRVLLLERSHHLGSLLELAAGAAEVDREEPPFAAAGQVVLELLNEVLLPEGRVVRVLDHAVAVVGPDGLQYQGDAVHELALPFLFVLALGACGRVVLVEALSLGPPAADGREVNEPWASVADRGDARGESEIVVQVARVLGEEVDRSHGLHADRLGNLVQPPPPAAVPVFTIKDGKEISARSVEPFLWVELVVEREHGAVEVDHVGVFIEASVV